MRTQLTPRVVLQTTRPVQEGRLVPAVEYIRAMRARTLLMQQADDFFSKYDAVLEPGTAGGTLSVINSTVKVLNNGTIGSQASPLTALNLDGGTLQLNANGNGLVTNIVATTITAANLTTINLASITNVTGSVQIPLISYTGTDPYPNLALGTFPGGYTIGNGGALVDNAANLTIDVIINSVSTPSTNASILKTTLVGTNLVLHGTNNNVGQNFQYAVLTSTNLSIPLSNWTSLSTNPFNVDGTFDYTNPIVPAQPRGFFDVKVVP